MADFKLFEGMWAGDLEDLVLPMISVDHFTSKVSDKAVVVGFYVNDRDAANDLNRFLQKSPVELVDTDVSPAPDLNGYYYVFVELLLNNRFAELVKMLLSEVAPLANIKKWKMRVRGADMCEFDEGKMLEIVKKKRRNDAVVARQKKAEKARLAAIKAKKDAAAARDAARKAKHAAFIAHRDAKNKEQDRDEKTQKHHDLKASVPKKSKEDALIPLKPDIRESVTDFLSGSDLLAARMSGNRLVLRGTGSAMSFSVAGFTTDNMISEESISMTPEKVIIAEKVRKMLGSEWLVLPTEDNLLMQSVHGGHGLFLNN